MTRWSALRGHHFSHAPYDRGCTKSWRNLHGTSFGWWLETSMQPQNRFARPSPDHSLTACWHRNDHAISIRCLRNKRPSASAQAGSQQPLNPQAQCCQECAGGSFGLRNKRPLCAGRPPSRAMSTLNLGGMGAPENQGPSRHGWAFISQTPESNFALLKARFLSLMFLKKTGLGRKVKLTLHHCHLFT